MLEAGQSVADISSLPGILTRVDNGENISSDENRLVIRHRSLRAQEYYVHKERLETLRAWIRDLWETCGSYQEVAKWDEAEFGERSQELQTIITDVQTRLPNILRPFSAEGDEEDFAENDPRTALFSSEQYFEALEREDMMGTILRKILSEIEEDEGAFRTREEIRTSTQLFLLLRNRFLAVLSNMFENLHGISPYEELRLTELPPYNVSHEIDAALPKVKSGIILVKRLKTVCKSLQQRLKSEKEARVQEGTEARKEGLTLDQQTALAKRTTERESEFARFMKRFEDLARRICKKMMDLEIFRAYEISDIEKKLDRISAPGASYVRPDAASDLSAFLGTLPPNISKRLIFQLCDGDQRKRLKKALGEEEGDDASEQ